MRVVYALAAAVLAAAGADAQQFLRPAEIPSAPAFRAGAAAASAPLLPSLSVLPSAPSTVMGIPGPGVRVEHVAAVQRLADETGRAWFIHGSRQTGIRHHDGAPFTEKSDLDLGVIGGARDLVDLYSGSKEQRWDGIPDSHHGPEPEGEHGTARRLAAPFRTTEQLARLTAAKRTANESFRFTVIGDAEPGRFWFSRALFNENPGAFWKILSRADRSGSDFIVQLGDMVSRGIVRNFLVFFRRLRDAALRTPYLTVIGNHDRHSPHGVSNDAVYRSLFGGTDYAFRHGGWRFVVVDTSAGRLSADQLAWLKSTLAEDMPTVVFTHMPPAPLGEWTDYGRKGAAGFKTGSEEFMRLMAERGVSRVYVGHVHGFGVLDRGGVRYVLTGGGGSPLFPGPVKDRFHHSITVDAGPNGLVETVHPLDGAPFPLRP